MLQENPYQLAEDIAGIGFKIADEVASRIGIHKDSDFRIKSGIYYVLQEALGNGHVYLPEEELKARIGELLGVELTSIERHLSDLVMEKKLVIKELPEAGFRGRQMCIRDRGRTDGNLFFRKGYRNRHCKRKPGADFPFL